MSSFRDGWRRARKRRRILRQHKTPERVPGPGLVGRHNLPVKVGGNAPHHIVRRGYDGYRVMNRVYTGKFHSDFPYARQARLDHLRAEMVEFQQQMVGVPAATAAFLYFHSQRTRNHVTAGQVFSVRRITFHKALAILVQQIAAFAAHCFADKYSTPCTPVG